MWTKHVGMVRKAPTADHRLLVYAALINSAQVASPDLQLDMRAQRPSSGRALRGLLLPCDAFAKAISGRSDDVQYRVQRPESLYGIVVDCPAHDGVERTKPFMEDLCHCWITEVL